MITSQEEYNKELKIFEDKIKSYTPFKIARSPYTSLNEVFKLFDNAKEIGLFSSVYCEKQKNKILEGINSEKLKDKVRNYLKKKGVLK